MPHSAGDDGERRQSREVELHSMQTLHATMLRVKQASKFTLRVHYRYKHKSVAGHLDKNRCC